MVTHLSRYFYTDKGYHVPPRGSEDRRAMFRRAKRKCNRAAQRELENEIADHWLGMQEALDELKAEEIANWNAYLEEECEYCHKPLRGEPDYRCTCVEDDALREAQLDLARDYGGHDDDAWSDFLDQYDDDFYTGGHLVGRRLEQMNAVAEVVDGWSSTERELAIKQLLLADPNLADLIAEHKTTASVVSADYASRGNVDFYPRRY